MSNIYSLGDEVINANNEEKDLGDIVSDTLKPSSRCIGAAKSANKSFGMINRTFVEEFFTDSVSSVFWQRVLKNIMSQVEIFH